MTKPQPDWLPNPTRPGKHIDPKTGILPIAEWGAECGRGWVTDERFARPGDRVIKRTSRKGKQRPPQ